VLVDVNEFSQLQVCHSETAIEESKSDLIGQLLIIGSSLHASELKSSHSSSVIYSTIKLAIPQDSLVESSFKFVDISTSE